jgi:hypothetical protein
MPNASLGRFGLVQRPTRADECWHRVCAPNQPIPNSEERKVTDGPWKAVRTPKDTLVDFSPINFRCKFEPLSPTDLATAFHDIGSDLVTTVMMRSGLRERLKRDSADPSFSPPGTGKIKCGCAFCSRGPAHGLIKRLSSHDAYTVSPL